MRASEGAVGQVRQDPQEHFAARDRLDQRRDALAHAVDEVRAHRVARVDEQMHHEHLLAPRRQRMHEELDVPRTAAARDHVRVEAVREVDDLAAAIAEPPLRSLHVGEVHDLDLADQDRVRRLGAETAVRADQLARRAERRDDRRLLDDHRHDVLLVVDHQVHAETERQAHHADHVLDHLVGGVELERVLARRERAEVGAVDQSALVHGANALLDAQFVEIGNPQPIAHAHRSPTLASANSFTVRPRSAKPSSITRNPFSRTDALKASSAPASSAHARPRSPPPAPLTL